MPRAHKGSRRQISVRVPEQLAAAVAEARAHEGVSSNSQYVADILAELHGMPELVAERGRKEAPNLLTA